MDLLTNQKAHYQIPGTNMKVELTIYEAKVNIF
jgi:hypothetical protein